MGRFILYILYVHNCVYLKYNFKYKKYNRYSLIVELVEISKHINFVTHTYNANKWLINERRILFSKIVFEN